jgi:hypothetical protein
MLPSHLVLTCQASVKFDVVELGICTHMAVTGPGRNAGLGESGLSEKGEKAEIRALADDGGLKGERTAIIMATHATRQCWDEGSESNQIAVSCKMDFLGATRWCNKQRALTLSDSAKADLQTEKGSCPAWVVQLDVFICSRDARGNAT